MNKKSADLNNTRSYTAQQKHSENPKQEKETYNTGNKNG